MNSSVTFDSDTSVMSSLCLEISPRRRSKGPSKLSRWTRKPPPPLSSPASPPVPSSVIPLGWHRRAGGRAGRARCAARRGSVAQPADQHAGVAVLLEVGEQHADRLPDDAAPVGAEAVLGAERQPGLLQGEQLRGGDVDGDLLVVPLPAARLGRPAAERLRPLRGGARRAGLR